MDNQGDLEVNRSTSILSEMWKYGDDKRDERPIQRALRAN